MQTRTVLLILTAVLAACGQTGDLYLPERQPAVAGRPEDARDAARAEPIEEPADAEDDAADEGAGGARPERRG